MNLDTFIGRIDGLVVVLEEELRKEVETIATDGLALVTQRVSETGTDAQGSKFKPYTPEYERFKRFAVGTAKKEGAKKKAARKTGAATKEKPIGRYRGFVDFTLSGQMLSSIGLGEVSGDGGRVVVKVSGRDEETRKKMEGNDNYRPGWFTLSQKEAEQIAAQSQERLSSFVQRFLTA